MNLDRRILCIVLGSGLLAASTAIGCSSEGPAEEAELEQVETYGITFAEWLPTVYREPFDGGVWIVNGDTPVETERELREFFINHVQPGALIVHKANGVDAKWSDAQKVNITYCVSNSFGNNYNKAVTAMNSATAAWEAAANVDFVHQSAQDGSCNASNTNVVFDVRPTNSGGQYLARAFFPNQSRGSRNVLIDNSAFGNLGTWTLAGVLRHELGHTLGFRHDHTRPESGACFEDSNWRALTSYDSQSVMHYPQCNGTQNGDLVLTAKDKQGAASLYGAPGGGGGGGGSSSSSSSSSGSGGGGSCEHDMCSTGSKLTDNCNSCVGQICDVDPFCCNNQWDSVCVGRVKSNCGLTCGPAPGCVHDECVTGAKLSSSCDPCVAQICAVDSYCCSTAWDAKCVSEVSSVCGQSCN